jgi:hypothetical protein
VHYPHQLTMNNSLIAPVQQILGGKAALSAVLGISVSYAKIQISSGNWIEGIHFVKLGDGRTSKCLYNLPLLLDWLTHHRTNPSAHEKAIATYLNSLPSAQITEQRRKTKPPSQGAA